MGDEALSVGGRVEKGEIAEVKPQAHKESKAADWEIAIHEARGDAIGVFTDGSLNEKRNVGGGWYVEGVRGGKRG